MQYYCDRYTYDDANKILSQMTRALDCLLDGNYTKNHEGENKRVLGMRVIDGSYYIGVIIRNDVHVVNKEDKRIIYIDCNEITKDIVVTYGNLKNEDFVWYHVENLLTLFVNNSICSAKQKPITLEFIRFKHNNIREVLNFLDNINYINYSDELKDFAYDKRELIKSLGEINIPMSNGCYRYARIGDYIVKDVDNNYLVYNEEDFYKKYEINIDRL